MLARAGHDIQTAHDGRDALAVAASFRADVILLDIGMPKMSGYEVVRRLRELPWGRTALLVALTGWGQDEDRLKTRQAGFDGRFVKPVAYETVAKLLAEFQPSGTRR